ncbi:RDD family protein [Malikia sp.]|uniref:RDD family protein n=1 Tax=Malikia sp. TaxID=2070706 RepID=UPI0026203F21|nr:RDD family protein [Malikia sp.]MDD2727846.1 RDD family protein [Malikia sp.]
MIKQALPHSPGSPLPTTPTLRRRMACWLYEGVLLFGVVFVAGLLFGLVTQTRHALHNRPEQQGFIFLVLGIYFSWCWRHGQTLPMRTWHIRMLGPDGRPPTTGRALLRYLLSWIWVLPPLAAGALLRLQGAELLGLALAWVALWAALSFLHPRRQFWHDAWAGTELVCAPVDPAAALKQAKTRQRSTTPA